MTRQCPWLAALGRFGNVLGLTFLVFSCLHETNFLKCKWEINVNTFSLSVRFQPCIFVGVLFSLAFLFNFTSKLIFFPFQSSCFFSDIHAACLSSTGRWHGGREKHRARKTSLKKTFFSSEQQNNRATWEFLSFVCSLF